MKTITVLNAKGKRTEVKAAALEIALDDGRSFRLGFPAGDQGDLVVEALSETGSPVMLVQPSTANLLTLHVLTAIQPSEESALEARQAPTLELSVQKAVPKYEKASLPSKTQIKRWVKAAQACDAEVTVRFVGEEEGRTLNLQYRQKDYATNVLSFPYASDPLTVGDLVLCWPVVQREAEAQRKGLEAHAAHLIVHGMLHLQGWDHETNEQDAEQMEAREREILARLGYPDPYEGER